MRFQYKTSNKVIDSKSSETSGGKFGVLCLNKYPPFFAPVSEYYQEVPKILVKESIETRIKICKFNPKLTHFCFLNHKNKNLY